jgi:branched-chain amino acid transport system substrate-binding protein
VDTFPSGAVGRRALLRAAAAGVAGLTISGCSKGLQSSSSGTSGSLKIGYVSPKTGDLAVFGESNDYVLGVVRTALAKGLSIGGKNYTVQIVEKDTQSNSSRAAQVAAELINQDQVDLILASSTPDTTNPVSDQCEAAKIPCLATICPWEMWFYKRGGSATKTFDYTYLYFLGAQAEADAFAKLWQHAPGGHVVGGLWPNDVDGEIYRQYVPSRVKQLGWKVVDSGAYQDGAQDFTSIISSFKSGGVDIVQATPIPPDFITFWRQASQNRFKPKVVSVAKALLFPSVAQALGPLANNLVAPVWWNPTVPYKSSLDGKTAQQFADGYQTATGKQWTQPMGFNHAIFEIAVAALKASGDPKNRKAVADAIGKAKGEAITGNYDFTSGPVRNVSAAPDLLGQWRVDSAGKVSLVVVDNSMDTNVPIQGDFALLT